MSIANKELFEAFIGGVSLAKISICFTNRLATLLHIS